MKIGIVGLGHVGTAMKELFKDAVVYDKYKNIGSMQEINTCDAAFVCVPTPQSDDGSCDTSTVDEVLSELRTGVIILRSTVPVGYTERVSAGHPSDIVFQPEYYGETVDHPFADLRARHWLTFGGEQQGISKAIRVYQTVYNSDVQICCVDSRTAELAKYMENCFLALKVTFCNEFYDIAQSMNVNYDMLREAWTLDPRIGRSHTFVYPDSRGYAGSCLPKDISATVYQAKQLGVDTTLLESVREKNKIYRPDVR